MANFSTTTPVPGITTTYTQVLSEINNKFTDLVRGLDPTTGAVNHPEGAIRWVASSNKWQKLTGTNWGDLSSLYGINISGNAATATVLANSRSINGVSFNGSADITITSNTTQALTFNNGGTGSASGTTFNGATARTISYNSIGAPSTSGVGATGTWAISISGNSATSTLATTASSTPLLSTTNWTVSESGGKLVFSHSGVPKASLDSSGNFATVGNVTAYAATL
jgi:hypothetical protein